MKPNCSVDSHGDAMIELDVRKYLVKPLTSQSMLTLSFMIWCSGGTMVIKTALLRIPNSLPGGSVFPMGLEVTCVIV